MGYTRFGELYTTLSWPAGKNLYRATMQMRNSLIHYTQKICTQLVYSVQCAGTGNALPNHEIPFMFVINNKHECR